MRSSHKAKKAQRELMDLEVILAEEKQNWLKRLNRTVTLLKNLNPIGGIITASSMRILCGLVALWQKKAGALYGKSAAFVVKSAFQGRKNKCHLSQLRKVAQFNLPRWKALPTFSRLILSDF